MKLVIRKRTSVKAKTRMKTKARLRKRIMGTPERPRLSVFRSSRYVYAQLIDDVAGKTLAEASSFGMKVPEGKGKVGAAKEVGAQIGKKAQALKVEQVVFDRNGFLYHGRVKSVAEGAREAGLKF